MIYKLLSGVGKRGARRVSAVMSGKGERMEEMIEETLGLRIKAPVRVGRSRDGLSFCGYRILPDRLLLSRRRKARYAVLRKQGEAAFERGALSPVALQGRFDAALAITAHADALVWRRAQLLRHPIAPVVTEA